MLAASHNSGIQFCVTECTGNASTQRQALSIVIDRPNNFTIHISRRAGNNL
jgi:hypothetical protein